MSADTTTTASDTGRAPDVRRVGRKVPMFVFQLVLGAGLLIGWQLASGRLVKEIFISSPIEIARELVDLFGSGEVWPHIQTTVMEFAIGYAIGATFGIGLGVLLARAQFASALLEPYIIGLYSVPKIALAPLFVIWLGIGAEPKIAIAALSAFFLVFVNSFSGMKAVPEDYISLAKLMGASRFYLARRVLIPAALPGIMLGLRAGIPYAMIGAVVGEFIASSVGLGHQIVRAGSFFDSASLFAHILILVTIVMVASQFLLYVERRVIRWRPISETRVDI